MRLLQRSGIRKFFGGTIDVTPIPENELLFWDDFSSGDLTKEVNGFNWFNPVFCTVVNTDDADIPQSPLGSTTAARFAFHDFENEFNEGWAELSFNLVSGPSETGYPNLYLRYYMYYPDGLTNDSNWYRTDLGGTDTSDNNKFIRLYDVYNRESNTIAFGASTRGTQAALAELGGAEEGAETIMLETGAPEFYASPGDFGVSAPWTNRVNRGRWVKVEVEVESPTETPSGWNMGNGLLRIRMDNIVVVETLTSSHSPANTQLKSGYLMGYMNSYPDNPNSTMYITDFAVSTTGRVDGDIEPFFSEIFTGGVFNDANDFEWTDSAFVDITTDNPYTGTHSLAFEYTGAEPPAEGWAEQRFDIGRYAREVWIDYKLFIPSNFVHVNQPPGYAENNKFFMMWRDVYSDYINGTQQIGFEYLRDAGTGNSYLRPMARTATESTGQLSGTVSTSGSTTLLGVGTAFLTECTVGMTLRCEDGLIGGVESIISDTELHVYDPFEISVSGVAAYDVRLLTDQPGGQNPVVITNTGNTGLLRKGEWNQIRIGARLSSERGVSDGYLKIYMNGHEASVVVNADLWNAYETPAEALFRNGYFLGYLNSAFEEDTTLYIDDVHFYTVDPYLYDDGTRPRWNVLRNFNDGVDNTPANEGGDGFDDIAGGSYYTNEQVHEGSLACKTGIEGGTDGYGIWGGIIDFPRRVISGQRLWFQMYMYIPESFLIETTPGSLKTIRFRQYNSSNLNAGYIDIQLQDDDETASQWRMIKEAHDNWENFGDAGSYPRDQWVRVSVCLDMDERLVSEGGNSRVRVWQDGNLLIDSRTMRTFMNVGDYMDALYLFTYWNGNAPQTQHLYLDDIRMSTELVPEWAEDLN